MIHQLGLSRGESKDCVFGIFLVSFLPLQGLFCVCMCVCVCVCVCALGVSMCVSVLTCSAILNFVILNFVILNFLISRA